MIGADLVKQSAPNPYMSDWFRELAAGSAFSGAAAAQLPERPTWVLAIAAICGIWYFFIVLVQATGITQLFRYYSSKPRRPITPTLPHDDIPHVTILRPVKGLEPQLYECLSSTFLQTYPQDKVTIYFCVSSRSDPAFPILQSLLQDFPAFDAKVLVEEEDPNLSGNGGEFNNLGPNPKIRNMSRGYREAKGDIIWIIDCNVWVGSGVLGRMVDRLNGYGPDGKLGKPYKFVHQLPIVVDNVGSSASPESLSLLSRSQNTVPTSHVSSTSTAASSLTKPQKDNSTLTKLLSAGGGRLEECFMATSHAKFYTAINTVSIAPCIVGKSNMFRRSHLNTLTSEAPTHSASEPAYAPGIDYFSNNICEDHLIGDLLWRKPIPIPENFPSNNIHSGRLNCSKTKPKYFGNHALVFGDLAIQPISGLSIHEYCARRVRWLRVRKWTVTLATLVEPGVESLLCTFYGAFALTTLPIFAPLLHSLHLGQTWGTLGLLWVVGVSAWMCVDWVVYCHLHGMASVEVDEETPVFARAPGFAKGLEGMEAGRAGRRRGCVEWVMAWVGRELLAMPIWLAAWGGSTVRWRAKTFRVGMDMRVHEVGGGSGSVLGAVGLAATTNASEWENGQAANKGKARRD